MVDDNNEENNNQAKGLALNESVIIILCFTALFVLLGWSICRERKVAEALYRIIREGRLIEVKKIVRREGFSNSRRKVLTRSIDLADEAK